MFADLAHAARRIITVIPLPINNGCSSIGSFSGSFIEGKSFSGNFNAGDVITENASEGVDSVQASVSYTLANFVENLTLTGASAINGTGTLYDNLLTASPCSTLAAVFPVSRLSYRVPVPLIALAPVKVRFSTKLARV